MQDPHEDRGREEGVEGDPVRDGGGSLLRSCKTSPYGGVLVGRVLSVKVPLEGGEEEEGNKEGMRGSQSSFPISFLFLTLSYSFLLFRLVEKNKGLMEWCERKGEGQRG